MPDKSMVELMIEHYQIHKASFMLAIQFECLKRTLIDSGIVSEEALAKTVEDTMNDHGIKAELKAIDEAIEESMKLRKYTAEGFIEDIMKSVKERKENTTSTNEDKT